MGHSGKTKRRKKHQSGRPRTAVTSAATDAPAETDALNRLVDEWSGSRSGAWASRGFDFQHTVGVWLASRLIAGDLEAQALIPEGFEDISIEALASRHVQIKSRAEHLGAFPTGKASSHILDAWARHCERGVPSDGLTVVFERGVEAEGNLACFDTPLSESLHEDSTLRQGIVTLGRKRGLTENEVQQLLDETAAYGVSWAAVEEDSRSFLGTVFERLKPAVLDYLARELRAVIAETAGMNASVDYDQRRSLDRSELTLRSHRFIEQVDLDALEAAITLGLCSPLSTTEALHDDHFYEGVATQPGHVAAGLVVPRADLIGEALTGIRETSAVILTGPSGVGKSALLWSIPQALRGVLWFRVNRLSAAEVPELMRLCRSYRVSELNPVGLLVDAAGTGQFSGWPSLRAEVAATPGLFFVSTARQEDLISLGDLSGCTTITVALDEDAAESIYNGLRNRDATDSAHWREAFEQSNGLTLEFTHLLTRGERLSSVIAEQVRRRITERRHIELDLLSLSATADRWSATIPVDQAAEACGVSQLELREATARLAEEHLLIERNGTISGVHQLRSVAISNTIHHQPPPTLDHTVTRLLAVLTPEQIRRFIPNALKDEPGLDKLFQEAASNENNSIVELTAYLRGLRLFDFYERAITWKNITERHGIPPARQPVAQLCAITGTVLPSFFPAEFNQAVSEMTAAAESARGSAVASAIGARRLAETLVATDDIGRASDLLFELEGSELDLAQECRSLLSRPTPLANAIQRASVRQVADIVAAATSIDPDLAQTLVDSSGGEATLLTKIKEADPWIIELRIDDSGDEPVAYARVLHVSDAVNGDPHDRVIALGRLLLRSFPRTMGVDVKLVLPGGHDYKIGDLQLGSTNLRREYDHSDLEVAWNRERMRVTNAVLGATDTERLSVALPLLDTAARLTTIVGCAFSAADVSHIDTDQLAEQINSLDEQAKQIKPRLNDRERTLGINSDQESGGLIADPLSGILTDLTGNVFQRLTNVDNPAALASHLGDNVIAKSLHGTKQEPWRLLGYDTPPEEIVALEEALIDLYTVVGALATDPTNKIALVRAARAGRHQGALRRAANFARNLTRRKLQARRTELEQVGRDIGWRFRVHMPKDDHYQVLAERLIALDLPSLIDWPRAVETISTALQSAGLPGEKFTLVPVRNGKPVAPVAFSFISSLIPVGTLGHWTSQLNEGHETPLTEEFDAAIASLQVASGILALPEEQRSHCDVDQIWKDAKQEFAHARETLGQAARDPITVQITELVDALGEALANEEAGESDGGAIASQLLQMAMQGHHTELTISVSVARLMAFEWDIDSDAAGPLFELD